MYILWFYVTYFFLSLLFTHVDSPIFSSPGFVSISIMKRDHSYLIEQKRLIIMIVCCCPTLKIVIQLLNNFRKSWCSYPNMRPSCPWKEKEPSHSSNQSTRQVRCHEGGRRAVPSNSRQARQAICSLQWCGVAQQMWSNNIFVFEWNKQSKETVVWREVVVWRCNAHNWVPEKIWVLAYAHASVGHAVRTSHTGCPEGNEARTRSSSAFAAIWECKGWRRTEQLMEMKWKTENLYFRDIRWAIMMIFAT